MLGYPTDCTTPLIRDLGSRVGPSEIPVLLEYKCEREGTHFVAVDPVETTKECAVCGVSTDKPLWVREHSCLSRGFTTDRDWNAAQNIRSRGIKQVGAGRSESPSQNRSAILMGCENRSAIFERLWGLRSLREPRRFLQNAS